VSNLDKHNEELRQRSSEQINYNSNIQISNHFSEKIIKFLFTTNIIQNIFNTAQNDQIFCRIFLVPYISHKFDKDFLSTKFYFYKTSKYFLLRLATD
jgi:hypothetical protein